LDDLSYEHGALYIITELCCIDLYVLSYVDREAYRHLVTADFVYIFHQMLQGLEYMHAHEIGT